MSRRLRRTLLLAALAWPASAWALLGVGDVVYDPAAVAQEISLLRQAQQEFDRLGSLLGVSTRQYDQLLQLAAAMGNATESAAFAPGAAGTQLQASVRTLPGLSGASLAALFHADGLLDAFLGIPADRWAEAVENPNAYYRALVVDPAIAQAGPVAGTGPAALAYAQWFGGRSAEDRQNLGARAAADLAAVLAGDWLDAARQRRINLQALAVENQAAGAQATRAQTVVDQQHAGSRTGNATNAILLESAVQSVESSEATVRALQAQDRLLQEQEAGRRDAAEMQLDGG